MHADSIHWILIKECVRIELPQAYTRDLTVHDREFLVSTGTQRFLYAVRDSGTHLVPLDIPREPGHSSAYSMVTAVTRNYPEPGAVHWYLFSHGDLSAIDTERAHQLASHG
jgi:hypothetical protein